MSEEICSKHIINIKYQETDKDHIHYCIDYDPTKSISNIVRMLKSYTTFHIWKEFEDYMKLFYKRERTLWTDGYFACSIGNVSEKILKRYIENQGK